MNEEELEQLLRDADRLAGLPPRRKDDLAGKILRTVQRRRTNRWTAGIAAACVVLGLSVWTLEKSQVDRITPPQANAEMPASPEAIREHLAAIRGEIATGQSRVNRLLSTERLADANARLAKLGFVQSDEDPADRAAFCVLYQADRLGREPGMKSSAKRAYREIIEYFPTSPSANAARQRLEVIQKEG